MFEVVFSGDAHPAVCYLDDPKPHFGYDDVHLIREISVMGKELDLLVKMVPGLRLVLDPTTLAPVPVQRWFGDVAKRLAYAYWIGHTMLKPLSAEV
jgi:hypothetical protein